MLEQYFLGWIFNMAKWIKRYGFLVILTISVILLLVLNLIEKKKVEPKVVENITIPHTVVVKNFTNYEFEKITKLIVNKTFGYDTISVEYHYMPKFQESLPTDRWLLRGYIIKNAFHENSYLIFVSRNLPEIDHMEFLCHELYHLYQFQSGRLVPLDLIGTNVMYDGVQINGNVVPYELRPHENEAFAHQNRVFLSIKKYLYK